jgi:hypothetical protein
MGYCHYWEIEQEIGQESFSRIVADVQRIILTLDDMESGSPDPSEKVFQK